MELEKYSMGVGDRLFGFECSAQLRALQKAAADGIRIVPVWNKSNREHSITGTRAGRLPQGRRCGGPVLSVGGLLLRGCGSYWTGYR